METRANQQGDVFRHYFYAILVIIMGAIIGIVLTLLSGKWPPDSTEHNLLVSIGNGLLSTVFITLVLGLVWSRLRTAAEREELQPIYDRLRDIPDKLGKLEGRLEAFKQLGFNNCFASRSEALGRFLVYAQDVIRENPGDKDGGSPSQFTVNVVSSSARGLIGYLDRSPTEMQKSWRDLITQNPMRFRMLLTHPAFAHLRQPAEERSSGDIELEILKTAIYLHCIAGMTAQALRFYRGSPTVFAVQAGDHILLNPYPYGKMAMDTLCLEFERGRESSYVALFMSMHFNHTWAFFDQPSKLVDGKPLVVGIENFGDILAAFAECTFLNAPSRLRLTSAQVDELDTFTSRTLRKMAANFAIAPPSDAPFRELIRNQRLACSDDAPLTPSGAGIQAVEHPQVAVATPGTSNV